MKGSTVMKKILGIFLIFIFLISFGTAFAEEYTFLEEIDKSLVKEKRDNKVGEYFFDQEWSETEGTFLTYSTDGENYFVKKDAKIPAYSTDVEYKHGLYFISPQVYIGLPPGKQEQVDYLKYKPIYVLDSELNIISTIDTPFFKHFAGYKDGLYWIVVFFNPRGQWMVSKDGVTWEKSENGWPATEKPLYDEESVLVTGSDNTYFIRRGETTKEILYENNRKAEWGRYGNVLVAEFINEDRSRDRYATMDGINRVKIPDDCWLSVFEQDGYIYFNAPNDKYLRTTGQQLTGFVKIMYNDKYLSFENPPVLENDRTLVPMRFLFEQMGATVSWDDVTNTATVTKGEDVISFSIDNSTAVVNSLQKNMDVPARLINNKTYIPLRFLSEELGYTVEWDEKTNTAAIK